MINESAPFSEDFASAAPGWRSAKVGHQLSSEALYQVQEKYPHLDKATQIGILFAMLHIRKGDIMRMTDSINKIFMLAQQEKPNDWIDTTANILKDTLSTRKLNTHAEDWCPAFSEALTKVGKQVKEQGISFHPTEFGLIKQEAQPTFPFASAAYKAKEPTTERHYQLNSTAMDASLARRRKVFEDILKTQVSSPSSATTDGSFSADRSRTPPTQSLKGPTVPLVSAISAAPIAVPPRPPMRPSSSSALFINTRPGVGGIGARTSMAAAGGPAPGAASLFNTGSRHQQQRPAVALATAGAPPPPPVVPAGASSLFIRSGRKNSMSRPPMHRASISADDNGVSIATTPKGFKRPQRTQMLDFNEQSTLEKNTMKNIDAANQKIQAEKEARKERMQEQRRSVAEKKRIEMEERKRVREHKQASLSPVPELDSGVKRRRVRAEGNTDPA